MAGCGRSALIRRLRAAPSPEGEGLGTMVSIGPYNDWEGGMEHGSKEGYGG